MDDKPKAKLAVDRLDGRPQSQPGADERAAGDRLGTLATFLNSSPSDLRRHLLRSHLHDWQLDPHSLGAYTYVPKGAIDASDELSVPVEATLFFAGEHTDTSGHWGTVHGALRSGYRAARQVLEVTG